MTQKMVGESPNLLNLICHLFLLSCLTLHSLATLSTTNSKLPRHMLRSLPFYGAILLFALCFLLPQPLSTEADGDYNSHLHLAKHAGLILSIPFGLDIICDLAILKPVKWEMLHVFSRMLLFASLCSPYFVKGNSFVYCCANAFRSVGCCGSVLALTSRFNFVGFGGKYGSAYAQSILMMSTVLVFNCIQLAMKFGNITAQLGAVCFGVRISFIAQLIIYFCYCSCTLYNKFKSAGVDKIDTQEVFTSAYFFTFTLTAVAVLVSDVLPLTPELHIVAHEYIAMGFLIAVLILPGRISKEHIAQLEHCLEQNNSFVRYISHEIRTPLNTVFLGLSFVKLEVEKIYGELGSSRLCPILETLYDANDSCQVALDTLNELLMFDKFECGKLKAELEPTSPWQFLNETVKAFRHIADERNIDMSVICDCEESEWFRVYFVELDCMKFGQVIRNLVSNALKFTPAGGKVEIKISKLTQRKHSEKTILPKLYDRKASLNGSNYSLSGSSQIAPESIPDHSAIHVDSYPILRIEVKDSGAGIAAKNLPRLFGQYVQFDADKLQQGGGSGLGLWLTKGIVEMHGGCIGATSDGEGLGSCFFVELPLRPCAELALSAPIMWSCKDDNVETGRGGFYSAARFTDVGEATKKISPRPNLVGKKLQNADRLCLPLGELDTHLSFDPRDSTMTLSGSYSSFRFPSPPGSFDVIGFDHSWSRGLSFLIADDSSTNRKVVKRLLCCHGHVVEEVTDGNACLQLLTAERDGLSLSEKAEWKSTKFDVILMDDNMPQLCGPEATKLLRDQGFMGVIIGVTGNILPEDVKRFQDAGANSVLSKPLNLEKLRQVVINIFKEQ